MSGVLGQDQQTSREGVPHVFVPRYVREHSVLNNLRRGGGKRVRLLARTHSSSDLATISES